jgi:DNA-binding CsgD family transcriptional regulator
LFHKTREDLLDVVRDYISAGLADNECAIWAIRGTFDLAAIIEFLKSSIPEAQDRLDSGQLQVVPASEFYLNEREINAERQMADWHRRLDAALTAGWSGLRISSDTLWLQPNAWKSFGEFECTITHGIAGARIVTLCTYELGKSDVYDLLDVADWHQFSILRRHGKWQIFEAPNLPDESRKLQRRTELLDLVNKQYQGRDLLTPREREVVPAIARGFTNKEVARELGISPRTAEFHRANIMRKLQVRNLAELVALVLA